MTEFNINSFEKLREFSNSIFKENKKVFLLSGDVGAGKTTFVSTFIKENLTLKNEIFENFGVMSPTFSLINQYKTQSAFIVHADMYRLKKNDFEEEELLQIIDESDFAFIEWPSKLASLSRLSNAFEGLSLNFKADLELKTRTVTVTPL